AWHSACLQGGSGWPAPGSRNQQNKEALMHGRLVPLFAVTCLAAAGPALAGEFGLYGSYWDTDALGETAGAGAKYSIGDAAVRFEMRGSFFPDLSEKFGQLVGGQDARDFEVEAVVPEAGVAFNFAPQSNVQLYLGGGLSYYFLDTNLFELDDEVGYYGLAGLVAGGAGDGPAFFVEALYRSVEGTVTDNSLEEKVELDLSGPSANAGVLFRF
ncbi:MAG: hypothetical protein ACRD0X_03770, partial [Thermoanaerobaculia bacterium]